jgi:hypothetical protein
MVQRSVAEWKYGCYAWIVVTIKDYFCLYGKGIVLRTLQTLSALAALMIVTLYVRG